MTTTKRLGRPKGSHVRTDLTAAEARRWWELSPTTGRLRWRESPGGNRRAGDPAGRTVTVEGRKYRSNRIAVLIRTGAWPEPGRIVPDPAAAVRGKPIRHRSPSPRKGVPAAQWRRLGI